MAKNYTSDRMQKVGFSETQLIINRIRQLNSEGIKIISFNSKLDTPTHVKEAAKRMLEDTTGSFYTDARGLPGLREALAEKFQRENGVQVNPETEIIIIENPNIIVNIVTIFSNRSTCEIITIQNNIIDHPIIISEISNIIK